MVKKSDPKGSLFKERGMFTNANKLKGILRNVSILALSCVVSYSAYASDKAATTVAPSVKRDVYANSPLNPRDSKLPNVLVLGDSISVQYTLDVQKLLKGKVNICRPTKPDGTGMFNVGGTTNCLKMMDQEQWLADTKWAVVYFNYGIHDLTKKVHSTTIEQYEKNLNELLKRFKEAGAKVIFATTTPLGKGLKGNAERNADLVPNYNAAAVKVMQANGVKISDLYAFALPQIDTILSKDNVHFTKQGSAILATEVAKAIEAELMAK